MEPNDDSEASEDIALNPQFREDERALLHALLQATDYGILMSGPDRQDIIANRRLGELFDLTPQHLVETDPEAARALARNRLRNPEGFDELLQQIYADPYLTHEDELELLSAPPRFVRRSTGPVRDSTGRPIGRLWTFLDITETKKLQAEVEAQLRARTEEFHATSTALQAMNDLCRMASQFHSTDELLAAIVHLVGLLFKKDCVALLLLSRQGDQFVGVGCTPHRPRKSICLSLREDTVLAQSAVNLMSETDVPFTALAPNRGAISRILKCSRLEVAVLQSQGRNIGVLVAGNRQGGEDCLGQYHQTHLRAFVDQIALTLETHRLQTELKSAVDDLKSAQRRMVEIEKLRTAGVLAASIAHDIRNILSTMQMEIEMQPGSASESLCAQLNRFAALTHRLLAFSRPSILETRPTSVVETIQRIIPLVAGQAEISGVEIHLDFQEKETLVAADASQLEHLFVNLCLNAMQAMISNGGSLTISVRADQHWNTILIEDTGVGISAQVIDRLFDPFFTTRANGFGLGLFSCKRIVEEHGGQLTVKSEPGRGACFTVMLPSIVLK